MTVLTIAVNFGISGCDSTPKEKKANTDIASPQMEIDKANAAYAEEVAEFKKEAADRIAANDKIAADFKQRVKSEKAEVKADYNKKIAELERKNTDMKKAIEEYKMESEDTWESFKSEFNHDLDELGSAFNDLTTNNVK